MAERSRKTVTDKNVGGGNDVAGVPLELVRFNAATSKFEVGQAAAAALRKVKGPVGVVAVSGRARQGKSFILNQLLHQSTGGFTVGPTHRPCTKGLWMWSAPIRRTAADGSEYHLLLPPCVPTFLPTILVKGTRFEVEHLACPYQVLTDTEGTDAFDQTAQYSTQIFSLAVLLSSLFVYNQMGGIDESAIDRLSLVTEMTKHIRVRAGGAEGDERLSDFTPSFLWLLRDFYLKLEEDGKKITPKDYLEAALMPVPGAGPSVAAKNQIRASIKSLFPDRDCFTLLRPMHDEAALRDLDRVPPEKLRPEFRQGVNDLIALIFSRAQPKRFGTQLVTGPVLAGLLDAYVAAINQGAVPTIATAWQGVAESECRRAADAAEAAYMASFDAAGVAAEEHALDAEHARSLAVGRTTFAGMAVGDEGIRAAHEKRFLQAAAARFSEVRSRKLAEAASVVNELLYKAAVSVAQAARAGGGLPEVQTQIEKFVETYRQRASGPTKWEKLADFLISTYPVIAGEVLARAEAGSKARLQALEKELQKAQDAVAQHQQRAEQADRQASASSRQLEGQAADSARLGAELAQASRQLAEARAAAEQSRGRAAALDAQMRESAALAERKLSSVEEVAEARLRAAAAGHQEELGELRTRLASEQQQRAAALAEVAALRARGGGAEAALASRVEEAETWRLKHSAVSHEKFAVQRERDEALHHATALGLERDAVRRELDALRVQLVAAAAELEAERRRQAGIEARMVALAQEAEAARAEALARSPPPAPTGPAEGTSGVTDSLSTLTINELRDWLTTRGYEEEVWRLQAQRPAPRKQDWLQLARDKAIAGSAQRR